MPCFLSLALVTPVPGTYPSLTCLQVLAMPLLLLGNALSLGPFCLFVPWLIPSQSLSVSSLSLGSLPDSCKLGWLPLPGTPLGLEPPLVEYVSCFITMVPNQRHCLPPRGHLAMFRNICGCYNREGGGATSI